MLMIVEAGTGTQWMVREECISAVAMGVDGMVVFVEGVGQGINVRAEDVDRVVVAVKGEG